MTDDSTTLRVLVVDDSAFNRQTIASMLEQVPGVVVVGRATNGKEALRLVFDLKPDLITLDLEMPEIDGFAFLRLLMQRRPTAVLVVSSHSGRADVFRALELGALDFIAKPGHDVSPELRVIEHDLLAKVEIVRRLQVVNVARLRDRARAHGSGAIPVATLDPPSRPITMRMRAVDAITPATNIGGPAKLVIAIGASTGGPPAVQQILGQLSPNLGAAIVIAQHMPARFTRAFAERLDRVVGLRVVEAEDGMPLVAGTAYVGPGGAHVEVALGPGGPIARVTSALGAAPSVTPSADRLFRSVGALFGPRACVVVLTGMGNDGTEGSRLARAAGSRVFAEDPRSAVMNGMPQSAVAAGHVDEVIALDGLAAALSDFVDRCAV
jgi:two-component system chemotaxis response regulator CheB